MQLLFYSGTDDQDHTRLEAVVHRVVPLSQIESFKTLREFGERLRKPVEPDSIAVLTASDLEELRLMQLLRGLLTEIYVVLVLPDRRKCTIELAHLLLPRFISQKKDDFVDLGKVLDKMHRASH